MEVKKLISRIVEDSSPIEEEESYTVACMMIDGKMNDIQIATALTALKMRGETPDILFGFTKALMERVSKFHLGDAELIDTCGTGGDGKNTFNISTISSFVLAGGGVRVAKHGNRSITSNCGSADLLLGLGIDINLPPERAIEAIYEVGIGFLFAPLFHTAMKNVMRPRRELGFKTLFNVVGPLSNPVGVKRQIIGVFSEDLLMKVVRVLERKGAIHCLVFHGLDGTDEISISGETRVYELKDGKIKTFTIVPEELGIRRVPLEVVKGGDVERNTSIALDVLSGEKSPYRDSVLLNSGAGFYVAGKASSIAEGIKLAKEAIDSGAALDKVRKLAEFTRRYVS
ncbi:MAG: anthranilate phosphoribosyltransferase [Candidatus Marinimicrobia bacterium]|nr:anthranilate phosphoribosyltransferase [Candidatus Neomarinimicrobiota bacterium]